MTSIYNATTELLDSNIRAGRRDKIAYIDPKRTLTYGELQRESCRLANLLIHLDLHREERLAMIMLDTVEFPIVFLGAIRAGIVPLPLNTLLTAEQYAYILKDARVRAAFVSSPLLPVVQSVIPRLSELDTLVVIGAKEASPHISFDEALANQPDKFETADTHPDEPAFWLYSSGSTGMPKGVKHVHTNLLATATTYGRHVLGIRADDVCLSAAKLFFAYGLGNALTFPLSVGATTILNPDRPTPALMFGLMRKYQPTIFFAVPTLFASMLGDNNLKREKGSLRLRICASAGEALPAQVGLAWKQRFDVDILDGVGSTEMLHIFLSNVPGDVKYGTSGRAVPGYELRLVNEQGIDIPDGEIGELLVRAPSAAEGYWKQREKSRLTFRGGWAYTGDKFVRDSDGRYTYCGRSDDMFKVSGNWVSPFEVESALISHPAILEAAVIPARDPDGLIKPKAFVVLKPGTDSSGLDAELKEHVKVAVGSWKYPRWIEIVDNLPKTATGKIQRFKLRERESAGTKE
jgi:4-hydroxybenzoate-CoA ligase